MRDIDPRIWKRAQDAPARRCREGAVALDLIMITRDQREYFGDPDLAVCVLDRVLDEEATLAACVLPDRVCWMADSTLEAEALASCLRHTQAYAEIHGAPEGRVWQQGFWYRPIGSFQEATVRGEAIGRLPFDEGLLRRFGRWPMGVWTDWTTTDDEESYLDSLG